MRKVDQILIKLTIFLMSLTIAFIAFDNMLFGCRAVLHTNWSMLLNYNWVWVNFWVTMLFLQVFVADILQLLQFNHRFSLQLARLLLS